MKIFKKKQQEIEHLKHLRADAIDNAAWWHMEGNYQEYAKAVKEAIEINDKLIARRRKFF